jgi:hypothetical protein
VGIACHKYRTTIRHLGDRRRELFELGGARRGITTTCAGIRMNIVDVDFEARCDLEATER